MPAKRLGQNSRHGKRALMRTAPRTFIMVHADACGVAKSVESAGRPMAASRVSPRDARLAADFASLFGPTRVCKFHCQLAIKHLIVAITHQWRHGRPYHGRG